MECPNCGTANPPGSKFCFRCGHDLRSTEATPPPEPSAWTPPEVRQEPSTPEPIPVVKGPTWEPAPDELSWPPPEPAWAPPGLQAPAEPEPYAWPREEKRRRGLAAILWFLLGVILVAALGTVAWFLDYLRLGPERDPPEVTRVVEVTVAESPAVTVVVTPAPPPEPTRAPEAPFVAPRLGTPNEPIRFAFLLVLDSRWPAGSDPIGQLLQERTGLVIESIAYSDYREMRDALVSGEVHIGWLTALHYAVASESHGVDVALVSEHFDSISYAGQIVANADAGIDSVEDLRGKTMCWVDPASTSGFVVPRIRLMANGIDPDVDLAESVIVGSHDGVVAAVYLGECDAGATYVDARPSLSEDYPDVLERVLVVELTAEIPNEAICFARGFPPETRAVIVDNLLAIAASEEGGAALDDLYSIDGLQPADDGMYEPLRADIDAAGIDLQALLDQ